MKANSFPGKASLTKQSFRLFRSLARTFGPKQLEQEQEQLAVQEHPTGQEQFAGQRQPISLAICLVRLSKRLCSA